MPGGMRRAVQDTVDAQGKATRTEITSMYDGKEYELKGAAMPTTRAYIASTAPTTSSSHG